MDGWDGMDGRAGLVYASQRYLYFLVVMFLTRKCFNMLVNVGHVFHDGVCGHQGGPIIHQLG